MGKGPGESEATRTLGRASIASISNKRQNTVSTRAILASRITRSGLSALAHHTDKLYPVLNPEFCIDVCTMEINCAFAYIESISNFFACQTFFEQLNDFKFPR